MGHRAHAARDWVKQRALGCFVGSVVVLASSRAAAADGEPLPPEDLGLEIVREAPVPAPRPHHAAPSLAPPPEFDRIDSLGLVPRPDGTFAYVDPGDRFSALVRRDGSVLFADRWRRLHSNERLSGRGLTLPPEGARAINPFRGLGLRGPNEWALAVAGQDRQAVAKAGFLARTFGFRHRLAVGFAALQFREGLRALPGQLLAIWTDSQRSATERRRLLFRRWDDAAEGTPRLGVNDAAAAVDVERARTALVARELVEAFVRRHLPDGSIDAYTPDELRRLNATRRSRDAFDPYSSGGDFRRDAGEEHPTAPRDSAATPDPTPMKASP